MQGIGRNAIGVTTDRMVVRLTTDSGAQTVCRPITACYASRAVWPPSSNDDNQTGKKIPIEAPYRFRSALLYFWPDARIRSTEVDLPAASTQIILS